MQRTAFATDITAGLMHRGEAMRVRHTCTSRTDESISEKSLHNEAGGVGGVARAGCRGGVGYVGYGWLRVGVGLLQTT